MAKADEEYTASLQNFSKALDILVKAMLAQVAKDKSSVKSVIEQSKETADAMMEMAEELKVVSETTAATKTNTEQILDIVKGIKKEKKTGMWDKLSKKDKTKSVAEGIKTIALMAGGILAIGMAFKVVGDVDFKSVMALAVALPLLSYAFSEIGETGMSPKDAAIASLNMIIMSAGVVASAYILDMMPEVDAMNMIKGAIAIGATAVIAGGAMWALNKLGVNPMMALQGSLAMAAVSAGLMASSWILSLGNYEKYPSLDWAEGFGLSMLAAIPTVLVFGAVAATGVGALVIAAGILSMMGVAAGIAEVSHIIRGGDYSGGPTEEWASGVGQALLAFALPMMMLSPGLVGMLMGDSMDAKIEQVVKLGAALKQVSYTIKGGSYTGGPSKEWSEGVGMALSLFANALDNISPNAFERLLFGDTADQNIKSMVSLGGALYDIGVAVGSDTSVYKGGPDKRWAEGVGLSISAFASALENVKPGFFDKLTGDTLQSQLTAMVMMAKTLPMIGIAIGKDTSMYKGGPSKAWAEGVGGSITAFASSIAVMADEIDVDEVTGWAMSLTPLASLIGYFGNVLSKGKYDNYPSADWSKGITEFITEFSDLDVIDDADDAAKQIKTLSLSYIMLAKSIGILGKSLEGMTASPDLSGLYGGIVTLSLVDSENLSDTLDVLNDKQEQFQKVMQMVQAKSDVKIDDSSFAFNKDKKSVEKKDSSSGVSRSASVSPTVASPVPSAVKAKDDKHDALMNKVVSLMGQMTDVLGEIADNTAPKLHDESKLFSN